MQRKNCLFYACMYQAFSKRTTYSLFESNIANLSKERILLKRVYISMLLQVQKIVRKKFSILRRVSSVTLTQASNKPPRLHASITKIARQQANKFFRRFDLHTADKLVTISRHDTLTLKNYSNEGTPVVTHRRSWNLLIPFRLSLFLTPAGRSCWYCSNDLMRMDRYERDVKSGHLARRNATI